ncbi:UrcA family protein [Congregibacter brevis]|uniref:UrcA family protein n=1 Tax=Congregibacter brevis TaxID=3081201 RepID=A0ABZ0IAZ5_9GAMM|nr:UrcA family protein [Congregibacter sp. IMCC45268]
MKTFKKVGIAAVVSGFFAVSALQANAESTTEVTADSVGTSSQVSVNYSDLDLNSAAGQKALHYRLATAAEKVCGHSDSRRAGGVAQAARNEDCYEQSLSRALSKVSASAVASTN